MTKSEWEEFKAEKIAKGTWKPKSDLRLNKPSNKELKETNKKKKTTSSETKTNSTSSTDNNVKKQPNKFIDQKITTELIDKITDQDLIQSFWQDFNKSDEKKSMYFDTTSEIISMGQFDSQKALGARSSRWITFNIPAIDALSRSNPFVKKAVNYLSSKPLINGIDINTLRNELSSEQLYLTQSKLRSQYRALKEVLSKGHTYGGSAGLIWIDGQTSKDELIKPLDIKSIRKNSFLGIKPLARWFQVEPALDKDLITKVGEGTGFYDASMIGMPMYYNVSLSGGLAGDKSRKEMIVHASRLLLFNADLPSFIETQIERYWGPSISNTDWSYELVPLINVFLKLLRCISVIAKLSSTVK